jgi:hypothetical protein
MFIILLKQTTLNRNFTTNVLLMPCFGNMNNGNNLARELPCLTRAQTVIRSNSGRAAIFIFAYYFKCVRLLLLLLVVVVIRGKERPGSDADHSPHLIQRSRLSRSYTSSPPLRLHGVAGELCFTLLLLLLVVVVISFLIFERTYYLSTDSVGY